MKDTTEFIRIPAMLVDSTYKSLEDGTFNGLTDFQNYLDDIFAIQPGVEGFKNIGTELNTATPAQFEVVNSAISNAMPNVPERDKYLIGNIMMGALSAFALGKKAGREELAAEIKAGEISVKDL